LKILLISYNIGSSKDVLEQNVFIIIMQSNCTICYGKPQLTFYHISSFIHRNNINSLPSFFWLMSDEQIFKYLHIHGKREKKTAGRPKNNANNKQK